LAESTYRELVRALADGRGVTEAEAGAWIDGAPYTDLEAVSAGLVDAIVSLESLPEHLGSEDRKVRLQRWAKARKAVVPRPPARPGRHVAVLRIEGMIIDGESSQPPMKPPIGLPLAGEARAGDLTVAQEARQALEDDDVAALVVWIDSPGGSATASEAMASALDEVAREKPVIAVMGAVAGSGGYYVATPAQHVFARPGTITGSIGVISGKMVVAGLLDRLRINREVVSRGDGIRLYDGDRPFDAEEIETVRRSIQRTYDVFVARVAASRAMDIEAVEAIAGGRVWTGRQALEHGLVDQMGGLSEALRMARELTGLGPRAAGREIQLRRERMGGLHALAPAAGMDMGMGAVTGLAHAVETLRLLERASALCLCPVLAGGAPRLD
jgi:protease-4